MIKTKHKCDEYDIVCQKCTKIVDLESLEMGSSFGEYIDTFHGDIRPMPNLRKHFYKRA